jgi:hypothetical protein
MTKDELFEEYLQQMNSVERRANFWMPRERLLKSEDFKKYCKWREVAYECKVGKRKMRRIAKGD